MPFAFNDVPATSSTLRAASNVNPSGTKADGRRDPDQSPQQTTGRRPVTPKERQLLKRVAEAAIAYVTIANNPPQRPEHKALDAERNAFEEMEDAVQAAVAARKETEQEPTLATFVDPSDQAELGRSEEGAWS
jgi:hypothetical protein